MKCYLTTEKVPQFWLVTETSVILSSLVRFPFWPYMYDVYLSYERQWTVRPADQQYQRTRHARSLQTSLLSEDKRRPS